MSGFDRFRPKSDSREQLAAGPSFPDDPAGFLHQSGLGRGIQRQEGIAGSGRDGRIGGAHAVGQSLQGKLNRTVKVAALRVNARAPPRRRDQVEAILGYLQIEIRLVYRSHDKTIDEGGPAATLQIF